MDYKSLARYLETLALWEKALLMAFGLNLGHDYRQGALKLAGVRWQIKNRLLFVLTPAAGLTFPAPKPRQKQALFSPGQLVSSKCGAIHACSACTASVHRAGKKTTQLSSFALKNIFTSRKQKSSSKGNVQVSCCVGNPRRHRCCMLWYTENPEPFGKISVPLCMEKVSCQSG